MEWFGTRFALTLGGVRLRVRIVLEDAPFDGVPRRNPEAERQSAHGERQRRSPHHLHPRQP